MSNPVYKGLLQTNFFSLTVIKEIQSLIFDPQADEIGGSSDNMKALGLFDIAKIRFSKVSPKILIQVYILNVSFFLFLIHIGSFPGARFSATALICYKTILSHSI